MKSEHPGFTSGSKDNHRRQHFICTIRTTSNGFICCEDSDYSPELNWEIYLNCLKWRGKGFRIQGSGNERRALMGDEGVAFGCEASGLKKV